MNIPDGFDAILHPPARLQIAAVVAQVQDIEFARLTEITGTSDSVMSKHLSALAQADYIKLRKATAGGRQRTWVSLTRAGRRALEQHVKALEELAAGISG